MEVLSYSPLWWLLLIPILVLGFRYSLVEGHFWKRFVSFGLRALGITILVLTLCRPFSILNNRNLHVVFLLDVSESIDLPESLKTISEIEESIKALNPNDSFSLNIVADGIKSFASVKELREFVQDWIDVAPDTEFRNQSRLSEALLQTRLSFPAEKIKRIVLYSDGQDTDGDWGQVLKQLTDENIDLRLNRVEALKKPEVAISDIRPSAKVAFHNEVVRLSVDVLSNHAAEGKLRIVHRGVVTQQRDVKLVADRKTTFSFDVDMVTPGNSHWTAEIIPEQDFFLINNQQSCSISVRGKPRVLILHQKEAEIRSFVRALEKQDFVVEVRGKFGVPDSISEMIEFDAILLADLPATFISSRQMTMLNQYVKEFGGGLGMLGSENSYGLGGYHKTPVEEVLPLVSRFEKEKEKPSLAMVLVLDKSGSMTGLPIALARQAAKSASDLLGSRDQIAVIGFDSEAYVVCEMTSAGSIDTIHGAIDSLEAGGGTNMFPAMALGKDMLENSSAKIKHMICLGDGFTEEADFESLTQAMTSSRITVSTVALGEADRQLMARIAEIGRGRYYETNDPQNVPQIFTKETMQASKSAIKEDFFGSVKVGDHPVLAGFEGEDLPFTLGYVMTQSKPTAQVLLVVETGDPLLAISRFGLGTGLAYTSDLSEKWGGEWLAWSDCGRYWGQILRGIVRKNDADGISVLTTENRGELNLSIRRFDSTGMPQSNVDWQISKLDDRGKVSTVSFDETGLGAYQASVPIRDADFTLKLKDPSDNKIKVIHYNRPYPAEYQLANRLPNEIESLPSVTPELIRSDTQPSRTRQSIAHYFYELALICFLIGILLRRI